MSAQNALYSSTRYVPSSYGSAEQLLQDLRSELLVEKEKRMVAEHRADGLAKQLGELQESSRVELFREGERRRDAEKRIRDLEQQLKVETEARKKSSETIPREQHLPPQRGNPSLLSVVDRVSAGRNFNGLDQDGNDRQRIVGTHDAGHKFGNEGALKRVSSLNQSAFRSSGSSYSNNNNKGDEVDDEEWQFIVRHNTLVLKNSGRASRKLTRKRLPENHSLQKSSSAERRNNVVTYFGHHDDSQGSRPAAAEHVIWRAKNVHERTQSPSQMSSGLTPTTVQVSKLEVSVNARGAEHVSKGGAADNGGIAWGVDPTAGIKGRTSNWPASERSEGEFRRQASLMGGYGGSPSKGRLINDAKKSLQAKKGPETEEVSKDSTQDSATAIITHKDVTYVTEAPNSSSLSTKTDIYADPAFKSRLHRKIFWEQKASFGEPELHVQSSPGDRELHVQPSELHVQPSPSEGRAVEESGTTATTTHTVQRVMKLRAKWDTTPTYSEA